MASEIFLHMTYQSRYCKKFLFGNLGNAIMNLELVLNLPNFKTIIDSLMFHFEVDIRMAF